MDQAVALFGFGPFQPDYITQNGEVVWLSGLGAKDGAKKAAKVPLTAHQKNEKQLDKATKAANVVKASAGLVSTAATAITTLTSATSAAGTALAAAGSSASVIPVVGWIAAAVAIAASMVVNLIQSQKVARELYKQKKQIDAALAEVKAAHAQADQTIAQLEPELNRLKSQVGLSGLGATWFEKKFYAGNTAKNAVDLSVVKYKTEFPTLERELGQKIKYIQRLQTELEALHKKVTGKKTTVAVAQAGGFGLAVLAVLVAGGFMLNKKKLATT